MANKNNTLHVGYVVKMFPRLSETFILNEILELERSGVQVTVFSLKRPNEGRFHRQLSQLQAPVVYLDELDPRKWGSWLSKRWNTVRENKDELWKLMDEELQSPVNGRLELILKSAWAASEVKKRKIQRLHAHFATLPSTTAYYMSRLANVPYSFTAHAKDIYVYTPEEILLRKKIETVHKLVTVTDFNHRHLNGILGGSGNERVVTLYNGIDLDRFKPEGAVEPGLIVGVGRLVPKKGFDDLLTACAVMKKRNVEFHCVIAGDGDEQAALTKQCDELGLSEMVSFPGAVTSDEAQSLIQRATVVALPCIVAKDNNVDALPTVLLESLGCGTPAISTNLSGIPEIIEDDVNGFLVEPHDTATLAERLEKVLSDPELRDRFSKAARETAERKFDIRRNVGTLRRIFEETNANEEIARTTQIPESESVG